MSLPQPKPGPARPLPPGLAERFSAIVGARYAITAPDDQVPYLKDWRDLYVTKTSLVLRPGSTAEVAAILALAHETGTAVVPQGGATGLVGGHLPHEDGAEIILSLNRMNAIRAVDPAGNTMIAEAGVTLQSAQEAAEAANRLFPLNIGSKGSCTIGGNLSTNAGGTQAVAYGMARDLVLGLEVVLADGQIWHGLRTLKKDNTGYDLKHLFMGAEGTLGIITKAVLKLWPAPKDVATAWIAIRDPQAAIEILSEAHAASEDNVGSC
ncbi:MAG: FAD-binding oxidoreductase, partial [Alphaproteobacteria bacterium]